MVNQSYSIDEMLRTESAMDRRSTPGLVKPNVLVAQANA
jgi:hypothetical protein